MANKKTVVMRERKDGGFSPCVSSEENVGKRKCCHLPGSLSFKLHVDKVNNQLNEITVPKDFIDMDKKDKLKFTEEVINNLQPVSKTKVNKIVKELRDL